VAHNGNLTNGLTLRRNLIADGAICQSTTDTEVIVHLVARAAATASSTASSRRSSSSRAPIALVALTNKKLIGARDPYGHPAPGARASSTGATSWPPRPAPSTSSAPASCATSRTARWW
jgi:hypothetical protein